LVTSTNSPDLGFQSGGRPAHLRTPLTGSAIIDLSLSGLAPWQPGDGLEFYVTEENDWDFVTERFIQPQPFAGATTVSFPLDVSQINAGAPSLITSVDHGLIAQLSQRTTAGGIPYFAMSRVAQLPPFDLVPGCRVSVTATMNDVSASNTVSIAYHGS